MYESRSRAEGAASSHQPAQTCPPNIGGAIKAPSEASGRSRHQIIDAIVKPQRILRGIATSASMARFLLLRIRPLRPKRIRSPSCVVPLTNAFAETHPVTVLPSSSSSVAPFVVARWTKNRLHMHPVAGSYRGMINSRPALRFANLRGLGAGSDAHGFLRAPEFPRCACAAAKRSAKNNSRRKT
jgi:hypothetical protein